MPRAIVAALPAPTLYYGEEVYRDLDTVAIVVAAEKPAKKVRIPKIGVYQ